MKLLICKSVTYRMREKLRHILALFDIRPKCLHKRTCLVDVPKGNKAGLFWRLVTAFFQVGKRIGKLIPVREKI